MFQNLLGAYYGTDRQPRNADRITQGKPMFYLVPRESGRVCAINICRSWIMMLSLGRRLVHYIVGELGYDL